MWRARSERQGSIKRRMAASLGKPARGGLGAGASDLIDNLLNDSKHRRCRAEQRLRKSVDRAQPQHRIR